MPNKELPDLPHFADNLVPMKVDRRAIPMIQDMGSAKFDHRELIESETTTPAGLIVPAPEVVQAEVVEESNTQRLRRLLAELDTGDAGQEHEDRLQVARELAARVERDAYVYAMRYVLRTVFKRQARETPKFVGQVGNKQMTRDLLLSHMSTDIERIIADLEHDINLG